MKHFRTTDYQSESIILFTTFDEIRLVCCFQWTNEFIKEILRFRCWHRVVKVRTVSFKNIVQGKLTNAEDLKNIKRIIFHWRISSTFRHIISSMSWIIELRHQQQEGATSICKLISLNSSNNLCYKNAKAKSPHIFSGIHCNAIAFPFRRPIFLDSVVFWL